MPNDVAGHGRASEHRTGAVSQNHLTASALSGSADLRPTIRGLSPKKTVFQNLRCLLLEARYHVAVDVQRHADAGMAEPLLPHLRVDPMLEEQSGVAVGGGRGYGSTVT